MLGVVTCLLIVLNLPLSVQLDYFCFPNGTLVVTNPDRALDAVDVVDEFNLCKPTLSRGHSILRLDHCKMDHYVTVTFFKSNPPPNIITSESRAYKIMCKNLPPEGVEISVSVGLGVRNHIEEMTIEEAHTTQITPLSRIFSLIDDEDSEQFKKLTLDDKFEWIFEISDKYHTLPESCTAYAGRIQSDEVQNKSLMQDGCSQDAGVLSHFKPISNTDDTDKNRYALQFSMFRFENEPFLTVVCSMRVCSARQEHNCKVMCEGNRVRRSVNKSNVSDTIKDMVVVLEVLDEKSADPGNTSSEDQEEIWKSLIEELMSSAKGHCVCIPTIFLALLTSLIVPRG